MRRFLSVVLYTALALGANAAAADPALLALREGSMKKLTFHSAPVAVPDIALLDLQDGEHRLADYHGKHLLVNFWATWCAPCRTEMPGLDRLQAEFGGDGFQVLTIASGRNPVPGIERFFAEAGIEHLPVLRDPKSDLSRAMGVMGLPVSVILNPEGQEIARLIGDAQWDGDSARAIITALTGE